MVIVQRVDGDALVSLEKEHVRLPVRDGALHVTRKRPLGAARASVLLVHGFSQNRYSFHLPSRSFTASLVARGFDTWNLDLRGHGLSYDPASPAPTFEDHAFEDVPAAYAKIVEATGAAPFLVAHSLGAAVSFAAAPRLSPKPRGVVSIAGPMSVGAAALGLKAMVRLSHRYLDLPPYGVPFQLLARILAQGPTILGFTPPLLPHIAAPGATEPDVLAEFLKLSFDRGWLTLAGSMARWGATGRFDGPQREDYAAAWRALDVPLYVCAGAQDRLIHPDECEPAWRTAKSADRTFRVFGNRQDAARFGHLDLLCGRDAPRLVWREIADWLQTRS